MEKTPYWLVAQITYKDMSGKYRIVGDNGRIQDN
jgi:hypothetical protein